MKLKRIIYEYEDEYGGSPIQVYPANITAPKRNPCEGCPQFEKVKRGESVVCNCTIPYLNNPVY